MCLNETHASSTAKWAFTFLYSLILDVKEEDKSKDNSGEKTDTKG